MLLIPIKNKYKKPYDKKKNTKMGTFNLLASENILGNHTLFAKEAGKISNKELESVRKILRRKFKKTSPIIFHTFPNMFITKKPLASRMGKGKGPVKFYECNLSVGDPILEFKHSDPMVSRNIFKIIKSKIAIKTIIKVKK